MPACELSAPIQERVRTTFDRLMIEITPDVGSERRDRGVAIAGIFLERLCDDRVQVSAERATNSVRRHRIRNTSWLGFENSPTHLRVRLRSGAGWMLAG